MDVDDETTDEIARRLQHSIGQILTFTAAELPLTDRAAFERQIEQTGTLLFELCVDTRDLIERPHVGVLLIVRLRDAAEALSDYMRALAAHDATGVERARAPLGAALAVCGRVLADQGYTAAAPAEVPSRT